MKQLPNHKQKTKANDNSAPLKIGNRVQISSNGVKGWICRIIRRGLVDRPDSYIVDTGFIRRQCMLHQLIKIEA